MSKSNGFVAPSEQLSMVIDPHRWSRHLSHFGAEGRAYPEVPEALRRDPFFLNLPKLNGPHPRLQEAVVD